MRYWSASWRERRSISGCCFHLSSEKRRSCCAIHVTRLGFAVSAASLSSGVKRIACASSSSRSTRACRAEDALGRAVCGRARVRFVRRHSGREGDTCSWPDRGNARNENEKLYDHWYQCAVDWQAASSEHDTNQDVFTLARNRKCQLQHSLRKELNIQKAKSEAERIQKRVGSLKEQLIALSKQLRELKAQKDMGGIKKLVPTMKTLK